MDVDERCYTLAVQLLEDPDRETPTETIRRLAERFQAAFEDFVDDERRADEQET